MPSELKIRSNGSELKASAKKSSAAAALHFASNNPASTSVYNADKVVTLNMNH